MTYTTQEAAELLNTARRNVQNYCARHKVTKRGRDYDIAEQDIEAMRNMKAGRPSAMDTFIKLLEGSDYGVEVPYAGGYMAYVSADDERGGYFISYCKGEMPPHATDHAADAAQAAAKVAECADLGRARLIEPD